MDRLKYDGLRMDMYNMPPPDSSGNLVIEFDGMKIPVVTPQYLAATTINYFWGGQFIIAPKTPYHIQRKRYWEMTLWA